MVIQETELTVLKSGDCVVERSWPHLHCHGKNIEPVAVVRMQVSDGERGVGLSLVGEVGSSVDLYGSDNVVPDDSIL